MITYRDATPADAAAIADVFRRSFVATFGALYPVQDLDDFLATMTADAFRDQLLEPSYDFRLAVDGDVVAGYVKLCPPRLPVDTPPDTIELGQLYVLDRWHGSGVAQALMDWVLATATARGARHLQLSVFIDNHRARRFYERFGFKPVGRYDFVVGTHVDEDIVLRHVVLEATP